MSRFDLPLSMPHLTGRERAYLDEALASRRLCGDGPFTARCEARIAADTGTARALLTHSCTAALEMAAILIDLTPGDEVIMPSFTFTSTANAFALRGAVPVFVDIRPDTLNLDETLIAAAITPRTRAIAPVHYAGVACEMDVILAIAARHGLSVVEDAAQAVGATYRGRPLGTLGDFGTFSFHETKNLIAGEGGALLVRDPAMALRAEIVREKGTDRARLLRGEVDRYEWQEIGSSYLPSEIIAAFLLAQLEAAAAITATRRGLWDSYHAALEPLEARGLLQRPIIPAECGHNGHIYPVLLPPHVNRATVQAGMAQRRIQLLSHYEPLHGSPAGRRHGRVAGAMTVTEGHAARLLRLPLSHAMTPGDCARVVAVLDEVLGA